MKKELKIFSSILSSLVAVVIVVFIMNNNEGHQPEKKQVPIEETAAIVEPIVEFGIPIDSFELIKSSVKKNEFLANILLPHKIDYVQIDRLAKKSKEVFDVRKIAVGKKYTILTTKDSLKKAQYFIYQPNAIEYIVYDLRDSISIYKGEKEVTIQRNEVAGTIHSSLSATLQEAKASPYLAVKLSDIFAWSIDFYRIQKGDWFKAIYEEKFVDGERIGIGRILAVEFNHYDRSFLGFYFDQDGNDDYFDEEANSLRKAFLKSPLKYSRLSSGFTMRRFHPVQKRWKAHLGTDYAAPRGTPIMATGDGVVSKSSYSRGNGKYVKIKHNATYSTQYLHMSRRNVKVGQHVKQGDIIGFVGSTGLATGPHVCYRFWKNGKQVNHLAQEFPAAKPINKEHKATFDSLKVKMQEQLDKIQLEQNSLTASK